ncbi:transcriptional regulator [Chromatium weissei]|nr:transcriptional regulator [Chromatium weissei]
MSHLHSDSQEFGFTFPCSFPIKAMGAANCGLEAAMLEIISRHAAAAIEPTVSIRPSRGGKWISVTVTFDVESRIQLDAIYQELTAHELVLWAL